MTTSDQTYRKWTHKTNVERAAAEAGIKGAAAVILSYLCRVSEKNRPFVRVSKETIAERTAYCTKTVKAALATLRDAGFLHPVAYAMGGRGRCPVYVIRAEKGVKNFPPLEGETGYKGGKNFPEKGGKNFPKRGEKTSPPLETSSETFTEGERSGASRPAAPPHGGLQTADVSEAALFAREHRELGLGEAMARSKARRACVMAGELR